MSISRKQFLKTAALLAGGSALLKQNLFARNPTDDFICALDCSFNLNNNYPGITNVIAIEGVNRINYGKSGTAYVDVNYEDCTSGTYHSATCDTSNYDDNLFYYVYYPDLPATTYQNCPLPAFIIAHPGGFSDCISIDNAPGIRQICMQMALRGYVCFSIEYRRGVRQNPLVNDPDYITLQQLLGYYRGCQDYRGAIRSIIRNHKTLHPGYPFRIDENRIFLGGESAGSLVAMTAEFFGSQAKIDSVFPGVSNAFANSMTTQLKSIDPSDVYYANPPSNSIDDFFNKVVGILNCWGALFTPITSPYPNDPRSFFEGQGYTLPHVILFAGVKDTVFDYRRQGVYFSPYYPDPLPVGIPTNDFYETEARCVPNPNGYTIPPDNTPKPQPYEICIGSQTIYNMLKNPPTQAPIVSELYLDCQMYHGLDPDCGCGSFPNKIFDKKTMACVSCTYQSNFGTSATNEDQTYDYIVSRAATFFQTLMSSNTSHITTTRFVECVNDRVTCTGNTTTSCSDDSQCSN